MAFLGAWWHLQAELQCGFLQVRAEKVPLYLPNGAEQQKKWQLQLNPGPVLCPLQVPSAVPPTSSPFPRLSFGRSATKPLSSSVMGNGA